MADDDTRKRVHQEDEVETSLPKRAAISVTAVPDPTLSEPDHNSLDEAESLPPEFQELHCFKLLCPQNITGVIIGRGGNVINQLISNTGARIKLSQTSEFFPMTTDRVLMINGSRDCLQSALTEIVTRMSEAPDRRGYHDIGRDHSHQSNLQIRVLIPKSSSASVVGKQGGVIRRLSELSGCRFGLGDEADPYGTRERIVSVQGTSISILIAGVQMLMNELLEDVRNRNYANPTTNYTNLMGYSRQVGVPALPVAQHGAMHMHHQQPQQSVSQQTQPVYNHNFNHNGPLNHQYMVPYQQGQMHQQQQQHPIHHLPSPPPPQNMQPPSQPVHVTYSPPLYPNPGHMPPMNNQQAPPPAVYQQPMYASPPLMPVTPPPVPVPMHPQYHQVAPQINSPPQIPYGVMGQNGIPRGMPSHHLGLHQHSQPYPSQQHQMQNHVPQQHLGNQYVHQNVHQMQAHSANLHARPPTAPTMGYSQMHPQQHGPPLHHPHQQQQHYNPPHSLQVVQGSMQFRGPSPAGEQYPPPAPNNYQSHHNSNSNGFVKRSYAPADRGGGTHQQQQWARGRQQRKKSN